MKVIYKYSLTLDHTMLKMPKDAWLMHVEEQRGEICVWALVDTDHEDEERPIHCYGTGHALPDNIVMADHIGTIQLGPFVWHFFDFTFACDD